MSEKNEPNDTPIELTLDDLAFIAAYFEENMNGTRAYMKLHPKSSYDSSRSSASTILAKPNIRAEVKRLLDERAMSAEEAIYRLGEIGRADLFPFIRIDDDGFVYFNFADPDAKRYLFLIKKIKTKRERRVDGRGDDAEAWEGEWVEVELHDSHAAIRDVLKLHGRFTDKVDLTSGGEKLSDESAIYDRIMAKIEKRMAGNDAERADGASTVPER